MKVLQITLVCLAAALLTGCWNHFGCGGDGVNGSGVELTETRDLTPFSALEFSGAFNVTATCGGEQSFVLTGDDNIVPLVITELRGTTLHVYTEGKTSSKIPLSVVLSCENLEDVTGSGVLNLDLSGVDNRRLAIGVNGAGGVNAKGKTGTLKVCISGTGSISVNDLIAEDVSVTINGAGSADVHSSRNLQVEINGTGSVRYSGEPENVSQKVSGMGTVTKN